MKNILSAAASLLLITWLSGCVDLSFGGGHKTVNKTPTIEQQLNDLEKARKSGAITQEQYDAQRTKLLENQ